MFLTVEFGTLPTSSSLILKKFTLYDVCAHMCTCSCVWHVYPRHMCGGQRSTLGVGPYFLLCLKQGLGMAGFLPAILALLRVEVKGGGSCF